MAGVRARLDPGFELLPADDEGMSPADAVDAAAESALTTPGPVAPDPVVPFGRTALFDFENGRMVRVGSSPAWTTGLDALKQWCLMVAYSARYAHPIFSDDFGVARPEGPVGLTGEEALEAAEDFRVDLREALLIHDRITEVELSVDFDPVEGVVTVSDLLVTTDEELTVRVEDFQLRAGVTDA